MITGHNIKEIRQLYNLTQEEFAAALGITRELVNKMEKGKTKVSKSTNLLLKRFVEERKSEENSHELSFLGAPSHFEGGMLHQPYHEQRREQKNERVPLFVPLVGIKAQAGFVKGYEQVDFMDTLDRYSLPPGVQPGGAEWSYFEVDGDSMEPTFHPGDVILASMVYEEDWHDVKNFGVYVILTSESLLVKRVFRKSKEEWVLISDNEEAYPQAVLKTSDIKQVWFFRRHINAKIPQKIVPITA